MSNSTPTAAAPDSEALAALRQRLRVDSPSKQLVALDEAAALGAAGLELLMETAIARSPSPVPPATVDIILGRLCQLIHAADTDRAHQFLQEHYPTGAIALPSGPVDYQPIQDRLIAQDFEEADRLTLQKMCELAGEGASQRRWLYFTEVERFDAQQLKILDALWRVYSGDKFGFSIQRRIWLGVGQVWDKFWPKIDWKSGNRWTRYPNEFQWHFDAPLGHLPLTNQLRGVRVMAALMNHPAWKDD